MLGVYACFYWILHPYGAFVIDIAPLATMPM